MKRILVPLLVAVFLLAGCNEKKDECQVFIDRSTPTLKRMAKSAGNTMDKKSLAKLVEACQALKIVQQERDPLMDCVLGATGEQAISACWESGSGAHAEPSEAE